MERNDINYLLKYLKDHLHTRIHRKFKEMLKIYKQISARCIYLEYIFTKRIIHYLLGMPSELCVRYSPRPVPWEIHDLWN